MSHSNSSTRTSLFCVRVSSRAQHLSLRTLGVSSEAYIMHRHQMLIPLGSNNHTHQVSTNLTTPTHRTSFLIPLNTLCITSLHNASTKIKPQLLHPEDKAQTPQTRNWTFPQIAQQGEGRDSKGERPSVCMLY
jgi:hypothetical protein